MSAWIDGYIGTRSPEQKDQWRKNCPGKQDLEAEDVSRTHPQRITQNLCSTGFCQIFVLGSPGFNRLPLRGFYSLNPSHEYSIRCLQKLPRAKILVISVLTVQTGMGRVGEAGLFLSCGLTEELTGHGQSYFSEPLRLQRLQCGLSKHPCCFQKGE